MRYYIYSVAVAFAVLCSVRCQMSVCLRSLIVANYYYPL
jgi:hypothetical protein